jgi:hypothetical protein
LCRVAPSPNGPVNSFPHRVAARQLFALSDHAIRVILGVTGLPRFHFSLPLFGLAIRFSSSCVSGGQSKQAHPSFVVYLLVPLRLERFTEPEIHLFERLVLKMTQKVNEGSA